MDNLTYDMLTNVRRRIVDLQQIERVILAEFGEPANRPRVRTRARRSVNGSSRKHQMHEWLKEHGPATRKALIDGSGFPEGTVGGYLSSETDLFEKRDGKWHALLAAEPLPV